MSIAITIGIFFIIIGLAGVLVFVFRKMPVLLKLDHNFQRAPINWKHNLKELLKELKYFSYRPVLFSWFEKILRKTRLLVLKIDNKFIEWIGHSRQKGDAWTIRSKAWMEHRKMKKREKVQVLEHLDKVEVSQEIEKITKEVAKEEDKALLEKIEAVKEAEEEFEEAEEEAPVSDEEREYIDTITQNPKNIEAYRALGFIYLRQKNYSDARASFRQVLKLDPRDQETKGKLEEIKGLKSRK